MPDLVGSPNYPDAVVIGGWGTWLHIARIILESQGDWDWEKVIRPAISQLHHATGWLTASDLSRPSPPSGAR
jgi:hypothetical protein